VPAILIETQRRIDMDPRTVRIRALNDELRQNLAGGVAVNDPYEEHDFGSFEAEGHTIFFKIDYFDRDLKYHWPDPTDPAVTMRVIMVMLADEY
jgi:hypothetical protein